MERSAPSVRDAAGLPASDSPTIALVRADPSEFEHSILLNSAAFRGPLDVETYFRREAVLAAQPLAADGRFVPWILVDTADTARPRNILASCETWRKRCLVARKNEKRVQDAGKKNNLGSGDLNPDMGEAGVTLVSGSGVEDAVAYGVASVFSRSDYRGRGYASRMVAELGRKLGATGHDDGEKAVVSILFSAIGKAFYAKHYWYPRPSKHIILALSISPRLELPEVGPILVDDLPNLCSTDEDILRNELKCFRPGSPSVRVAFVPDVQTLGWFHAREEYLATVLGHSETPTVKGAQVRLSHGRVWCVWTRTFGESRSEHVLDILRFVVDSRCLPEPNPVLVKSAEPAKDLSFRFTSKHNDPENSSASQEIIRAIAVCFQAAQNEASQWKMTSVQAWNPTPWVTAGARALEPRCEIIDRPSKDIVSLRWFGPENIDDIELAANEMFQWC